MNNTDEPITPMISGERLKQYSRRIGEDVEEFLKESTRQSNNQPEGEEKPRQQPPHN
jgi:hypothetical protein